MIIKDKSIYLDYVEDIENKMKNLCKNISSATMQDSLKQDIEKTRVDILAKIFLIRNLAEQETGFIPNIDLVRYKKEINELYEHLSNIVKGRVLRHNTNEKIL